MTVQWGDTGKAVYGTQKTFNISFPTPRETLLGTPVNALPTANPGTPQVTMTIQTSDLPVISPSAQSLKYTAILYVAGKNTDAAAQTINYQCYKNGVAVTGATGSQSVATNTFWTFSLYRFFDVSVGDVLGVSLWSASANMNYDYYSLVIFPSRPTLGTSYINKDVTYSNFSTPSLFVGNPVQQNANGTFLYPSTGTSTISANGNVTFGALNWNGTYQAFRIDRSDNTINTGATTHATNRPYYQSQILPTKISFREILR